MQISQTWFPAIGDLGRVKVIFFLLLLPHLSWSQVTSKTGPSSEITINGTSSLSDWESAVNTFEGQTNEIFNGEELQDIRDLHVTIPENAIKSGHRSMDKNTYETPESTAHPKIEYVPTCYDLIPGNMLNTTGELQIAGITKQLQMQVNYNISAPEKAMFTREMIINFGHPT